MQRLKSNLPSAGWILLDALLALALWSVVGIALMMQARWTMVAQRNVWRQIQAIEWQADLFERMRLAQPEPPLTLDWGQTLSAGDCTQSPCNGTAWRDSLLADWQNGLLRDWPGVQTWLAPWSQDPRIWVVGIRWPEPGLAARELPINQQRCPPDWYCMLALGWP
jgi:hypothetical protein